MSILSTIRQEINDFIYNDIRIVEGYSFNQYNTIKRTHLYDSSRFEDNSLINGREKIFFNISSPRRDSVARFMDVDVKDVRFDEINPVSNTYLKILNQGYMRYAEKYNISRMFNKMAHIFTTYGSIVIKDNGGEPEIIDLRKLFLDPTVECIKDSRFIIVKHEFSPTELRAKVKDGWDKNAIERIIKRVGNKSATPESYEDDRGGINTIVSSAKIEVYERYGYLPKKLVKGGNSEKEIYTVTIAAEPLDTTSSNQNNQKVVEEHGEVLFKSEWRKEPPFEDEHFVKIPGRWLGVGVFEVLFPAQERFNELMNQRRISMELSAMHLFQTADNTVLNNLLNDLQSGDVIKTKIQGSLQPIVNEERNLPAFQVEEESYKQHADRLTFSNDLLTGGDIPSSTPATNVVVQNNNQVLVHLQKRENFANLISVFTKKFVFPQLIKDLSPEQFLKVVGDPEDLQFIDDVIVNIELRNKVINDAIEKGIAMNKLTLEEYEKEVRNKLAQLGGKRYVKLLKDYLKKHSEDIIVHVDNEKKDISKVANNTFQFYTAVAQNPQALSDPVNKVLLTSYAREIGVDTDKLEVAFAKRQQALDAQQQAQQVPQDNAQVETTEQDELAQVL